MDVVDDDTLGSGVIKRTILFLTDALYNYLISQSDGQNQAWKNLLDVAFERSELPRSIPWMTVSAITIISLLLLFATKKLYNIIYQILFEPLDRLVDFDQKRQQSPSAYVAKRHHKRIKDLPPVYPNGWFKICNSWELKRGQVIYRSMLGLELAVYRAEHSDDVYCIDAYCTHLGANLTVGGKVNGAALTCPFHHWSFDGNGKCISIGDAPLAMPILTESGRKKKGVKVIDSTVESCKQVKFCEHRDTATDSKPTENSSIPQQAHTTGYLVEELNDHIYLWFDAEGRKPTWKVPSVRPNLNTYSCKMAHHVYCHVQEIPENGPDAAHLNVVHREIPLTMGLVWNIWGASWSRGTTQEDAHVGYFRVQHVSTVSDWFDIPFSNVDVKGGQYGPGVVKFDFGTPVGRLDMIQTVTPVGPMHMHVEHVVYIPWYLPRVFAKWFLLVMTSLFEQDIPIWNQKTFINKPVLVKNDGPIGQFRRWYSQFYSENSPTIKSLSERSLDW